MESSSSIFQRIDQKTIKIYFSVYPKFPAITFLSWKFSNFIPKVQLKGFQKVFSFSVLFESHSFIFVNLKKSREYFKKLYIQIVDFGYSYRFHPFPINKFERFEIYEIPKFCGEMSWRCLASELRLNAKTNEFLSSFIWNVVRKDTLVIIMQFRDVRCTIHLPLIIEIKITNLVNQISSIFY
jgi:hypothetical protein